MHITIISKSDEKISFQSGLSLGFHSAGAETKKTVTATSPWLRDVCLLAQAAGYLHDWGKSSQDFADKLQRSVQALPATQLVDPEAVRHEWLSYCLLKAARDGGFENAWIGASSEVRVKDLESLKKGILDKNAALEFLIVSHHKLLGKTFQIGQIDMTITPEGHVKKAIPLGGVQCAVDAKGALQKIDQALYEDATRLIANAGDHMGQGYWFPVSIVARACMILADHQISSIDYHEVRPQPSTPVLFANTKSIHEHSSLRRYDQPLDWHLRKVGEKAGEIAQHLSRATFDGLSQVTIDSILERSRTPRFTWQDKAVDFLVDAREMHTGPALVFSGAGTGAGKTRANAKIVCALSPRPRFCVALNLRSLTLQTGDSLRNDLKIMPSEMAVVIGDRTVEKLHKASSDAFSITGVQDSDIEVVGPEYPVPQWLKAYSKTSKSNQLLMPPVLVSTIDFVINASEPGCQGHHALAMLRVMNSDLVLDELDSYDPTAMIAVLRLIQMSAMLGRNVVCSSATLSVPVATAVFQAFMSGAAMRKLADPTTGRPLVVLVDDLIDPERVAVPDSGAITPLIIGDFKSALSQRHGRLIAALAQKPVYRMPVIGGVGCKTDSDYFEAIKGHVDQMHAAHQWSIGLGRELSFGLIRVANIKTAIALARHLSKAFAGTGAKICCYHSNELRIQRHLKEKRLDFLLSRKDGAFKHIAGDKEINAAFTGAIRSVPFIVIATPVEEVGRDHDFDWAIIEPSSAQSIVQTCGRVNRHRLVPITTPNVLLMDKNLLAIRRPGQPCFIRPGLEGNHPKFRYKSQCMSMLAGSRLPDRIDASFRLGGIPMGIRESEITELRLSEGLRVILRDEGQESHWMSQGFYQKFALREFSKKEQFRFVPSDSTGLFECQQLTNADTSVWLQRGFSSISRAEGDWLCWSNQELMEQGEKMGIRPDESLFLELARHPGDEDATLVRDESFGYMLVKQTA